MLRSPVTPPQSSPYKAARSARVPRARKRDKTGGFLWFSLLSRLVCTRQPEVGAIHELPLPPVATSADLDIIKSSFLRGISRHKQSDKSVDILGSRADLYIANSNKIFENGCSLIRGNRDENVNKTGFNLGIQIDRFVAVASAMGVKLDKK